MTYSWPTNCDCLSCALYSHNNGYQPTNCPVLCTVVTMAIGLLTVDVCPVLCTVVTMAMLYQRQHVTSIAAMELVIFSSSFVSISTSVEFVVISVAFVLYTSCCSRGWHTLHCYSWHCWHLQVLCVAREELDKVCLCWVGFSMHVSHNISGIFLLYF